MTARPAAHPVYTYRCPAQKIPIFIKQITDLPRSPADVKSGLRVRIRMDPNYFGKMDPDPH
jgi:hypothetical protein